MLAALDPRTWWFVTRASGLVAWALLSLAVIWGLALSTKTFGRNPKPAWLLDLHRHLGGLAVVFTGVHLLGLVADTYVAFGWRELFVPLASTWKPGAVAWGIVAFYVLLAVEMTSLLQRHLPRTWWRRFHVLSFPLFVFATAHLVTAGTDAGSALTQWMAVVVSTIVAFLVLVRLIARREPIRPRPSRAAPDDAADLENRLSRLRAALPADEG